MCWSETSIPAYMSYKLNILQHRSPYKSHLSVLPTGTLSRTLCSRLGTGTKNLPIIGLIYLSGCNLVLWSEGAKDQAKWDEEAAKKRAYYYATLHCVTNVLF